MFSIPLADAPRPVHKARRSLLAFAAVAFCSLAAAQTAQAQLAFSPDCRNHQQIQVNPPKNAILFSKHPVPHPAGTATVFAINGLNNYVVPAGVNSCVVAAPDPDDNYCFQARSDGTILQVGFQAITNPGGLPACQ
ncbi:hypothetical protein FMN63_01890 [Stappia sp. BW2]|uniref:hypothetical protein n=1 Tax=Stappia sp. BW2 TaxID=2592622 RepID=UPI0011DE6F18|nr:hypothetical protein [Stappia sp. BW2]TYC80018.1 hypothetical protein FMN63_01890 [Stappia sp. BW2]